MLCALCSTVFHGAEHVALGTSAAVKVLTRGDERAKGRFLREAKLLARMKSKSFPRFFAYGEANGRAYLAMELLEPGDMPSGDKAVARFMLKVCDAVAELHSHGLVHRGVARHPVGVEDQDHVPARDAAVIAQDVHELLPGGL